MAVSPAAIITWATCSPPKTQTPSVTMPTARNGRGDAHERDADGQTAAQREAAPAPAAGSLMPPAARRRGTVAHAAHGHDVAGLLGVVAELVAQAADVDVDGAVEHIALARAVDRVEQLVAA